MFAEERRQLLVSRARQSGRLDVASVSEELQVAPETIRRDLTVLVSHGLLRRVHGGAIPVERLGFEGGLESRAVAMPQEKHRIAQTALELIDDAESIYLDEGSTSQLLADMLPTDRELTVVTSALPIGMSLASRTNITLLMVGGRVRGHTVAAVDHWATRMIQDLVIDLCFLGTNGVTLTHGLTTPDPAVAAVKSAAVDAAARRVLIADHTKFGVNSFCRFASVRDLETIVTDTCLSDKDAASYSTANVEVVRA